MKGKRYPRRWGDGGVFDGASIVPSLTPGGYGLMAAIGLLVAIIGGFAFAALELRPALLVILLGAFVFALAWYGARGPRW